MPQWRKLHTKTLDSLDVNDMPDDFTRLLWVILPLILDRCGRGIDNAAWVRAKAFPLREDVTPEQVDDALCWYADRGMTERYTANDRPYFSIPTWHDHQGATTRETASNIPARPTQELCKSNSRPTQELVTQDARVSQELVVTNSRPTHAQECAACTTNSCTEEKRVEEKRIEEKRVEVDTEPHNAFSVYERATGVLSPLLSDALKEMIDDFEAPRLALGDGVPGSDLTGDEWVQNAIVQGVAGGADRISTNYIRAILDRWKAEGYKAPWKGKRGKTTPCRDENDHDPESPHYTPELITELGKRYVDTIR